MFVIVGRLDQAEVDQLGLVVEREEFRAAGGALDQHVLGLDVAMDQARGAVDVGQALGELADHGQHVLLGQRAEFLEQRGQARAGHVLHRQVVGLALSPALEDVGQVGMAQADQGLGLAVEAVEELAVPGQTHADHLERALLAAGEVDSEKDGAHATGAQFAQDGEVGQVGLLVKDGLGGDHGLGLDDVLLDQDAQQAVAAADQAAHALDLRLAGPAIGKQHRFDG